MKLISSHRVRTVFFALLLVLLPVAALAATGLLSDGLLPWHTTGGSSAVQSTAGDYSLAGAAGVPGNGVVASAGGYSLSGGFVPVPEATSPGIDPPQGGTYWLPIVTSKR